MNWLSDYEAETAAAARAQIAAEDAAWAALTEGERAAKIAAREAARAAEDARQERIAHQHAEQFGPDDETPEDEE